MIMHLLQPCNHQSPSWPRPEGPSCGGRRGPKTLWIGIPRHIHATIVNLLRTLYRRVHLGSRHTMHASEVSDAEPLRCISCMLLCSGSYKLTGSPGILKFPGGADAGALRPPQHLHMPCWAYPVDSRPFYSSCDSRVGCPSSRGTQGRSRFTILLPYCFINLRLRKL